MALALFDLDNTLLSDDSDYQWGQFLAAKNLVDKDEYDRANKTFYNDYKNGTLDIAKFSAFSFKPLSVRSMEELNALHKEFMRTIILPIITDKARALVKKHQDQGDTLVVITATNSFITRPIAYEFGITNLIATEPKIIDGRYTTEIDGTPCFQEGKIIRLNQWLKENKNTATEGLKGSTFYSDSINDISLLEAVDTAVAVDPDDKLREVATTRGWEIISLRN